MKAPVNPQYNLLRAMEFSAPVSPATSLDLVVGSTTDDEGMTWPERRTFTVSHIVQSPDGKVWRVAGFTLANTVIVRPHGLGHEAGIVTVEYQPAALVHPAQADIPVMHREGLVLLVGGAL